MEFVYGIATSTEVAYYTYIYAKVPQEAYKAVTSYTRAAILTGRFGSGLLAQVLTSTGAMDYGELNYLSLASVVLCLVLSLSLPAAKTSVYFHRDDYERTSSVVDGGNLDDSALDEPGSGPKGRNVENFDEASDHGEIEQYQCPLTLVPWTTDVKPNK
jgi:thiamine transporter 2/3